MDKKYIEPHSRAPKGAGRKEHIVSIRIPSSTKKEIDAWKKAYENYYGKTITYESMFKWWMDNIGRTDTNWDYKIRDQVDNNIMESINDISSKAKLTAYLNGKGYFWEYCNKASQDMSDDELIFKGLLFLEFEDMNQLFELFGYSKCKSIFEERIANQDSYYSNITYMLRTLFF